MPRNTKHSTSSKKNNSKKTQKKKREETKAPEAKSSVVKPVKVSKVSKATKTQLSIPRVRKFIDKCGINKEIELACVELKSDSKTLSSHTSNLVSTAYEQVYVPRLEKFKNGKLKEFKEKTESVAEKIEFVSKMRYRFSGDSVHTLTSVLDIVVSDILKLAMKETIDKKKAIIQVSHVNVEELAKLPTYPLIKNLPIISTLNDVAPEVSEPEDNKSQSETSFEFYVNAICKNLRDTIAQSSPDYSSIRVSKAIRKFCSDLVIQLIDRVIPLLKLYMKSNNTKTINTNIVKFIFQYILVDSGVDVDNCNDVLGF